MQIICLAEAEQNRSAFGVAGFPQHMARESRTAGPSSEAQSCIGPFELDPITRMSLERPLTSFQLWNSV